METPRHPARPETHAPRGFAAVARELRRAHGYGSRDPSPHRTPPAATAVSAAKPSNALTAGQVQRLRAAAGYGAAHWHHWVGATVSLRLLDGFTSPEAIMRAVMDHTRKWQQRHAVPPYWAWVRECGPVMGDHCHIIAAVPAGGASDLHRVLCHWLAGGNIRGDSGGNAIKTSPTSVEGWLRYCTKTMNRPDKYPIIGQRLGISGRLGPKAREAAMPGRSLDDVPPWTEGDEAAMPGRSLDDVPP